MYKFLLRPKWLAFHVLILALVVVMLNLGLWQVHRLQQRMDFNDQVRSSRLAPTEPISSVLTDDADLADIEWRPVTATGTFLENEELQLVNVSQGGAAGIDLISALELPGGTVVFVNRGFVPLNMEIPKLPIGQQTITGYLRKSANHRTGATDNSESGELTEIQRIDIPRLAQQIDADVLPMYIQQATNSDVAPFAVELPSLDNGPHLSYAIQWVLFSICAIVGWVLVVRKTVRAKSATAV